MLTLSCCEKNSLKLFKAQSLFIVPNLIFKTFFNEDKLVLCLSMYEITLFHVTSLTHLRLAEFQILKGFFLISENSEWSNV